jgi:hypothetical protein
MVGQFTSTGLNSAAIGATTPNTGAFTTLSATGLITSTLTSGEAFKIGSSTAGTGILYMSMFNTSGGLYLGLEGSAGGTLWTGIPAYATGLGARTTGGGISFSANSTTQHMLLTTTGLAVTGTLSSTGATNLCTASGGTGITTIGSTTGSPPQVVLVQGNNGSGTRVDISNLATNGRRISVASNQDGNGNLNVYDWTLGGYLCSVGAGKTLSLQGATPQTGTGITFPATQSASSDANTLDDYREATATLTATGMTTSPTGTATLVKNGNIVVMELPAISGTSNATTFTVTGIPAAFRPSATRIYLGIRALDNGAFVTATTPMGFIDTAGTITLYKDSGAAAWTNSGTKGTAQCIISYII